MPEVVEAPYDELVIPYESLFGNEDRIAFLDKTDGLVQMAIKGWFVRDDEIVSAASSTLQDIERCHHGHRYAGDWGIGITCFEGVDCRLVPGDAQVILDALNDLVRRRTVLRKSRPKDHRQCDQENLC